MTPVLNKIITQSISNSLYAAYSDGKVLRYDVKSNILTNIFSVYDKTDVIDIEAMGSTLLTCSHNEITIFDIIKQKSMSLKVILSSFRGMSKLQYQHRLIQQAHL